MENVKYKNLENTFNHLRIKVLEHGYFRGSTDWRYFGLTSPFSRFYFISQGKGFVEMYDEITILEPGRMYIIPPNVTFNIYCDDYIEKFYLHMNVEFWEIDVFNGMKHCTSVAMETGWLEKFLNSAGSNDLAGIARFQSMLWESISKALAPSLRNFDSEYAMHYKYSAVHTYIRDHLSATLTPKEIAQALHISLSSLVKNYKKDNSITLHTYICNALLKSAIEKLLFSSESIKQISFDLQFSDEFYFSRFFKKLTGNSPKKYRESSRY